jgi:ABC-type amino acid transport substrate-binding protein
MRAPATLWVAVLFGLLLAVSSARVRADEASQFMTLPKWQTAKGGLEPIIKRRVVRILGTFTRTQFFADGMKFHGFVAESGRKLEKELNARYGGTKKLNIRVEFLPTRRGRLLRDLVAGRGDIAAGDLTITRESAKFVDFLDPWETGVNEIAPRESHPKIRQ